MTKQEWIKEGLIEMLTPELKNRQEATGLVRDILLWLNLKGVVIKKEKKDLKAGETYLTYIVEPLIEEE